MASTFRRPGVFVSEVSLPQQIAPLNADVAVGAFAGAALRGPVDAPSYVGSWSDFTRLYGSFKNAAGTSTYRLATAVYQFFANGGRAAYVQRVVGDDTATATVTLKDAASSGSNVIDVSASSAGEWGKQVYVQAVNVRGTGTSGATVNGDVFDLIVYYGGTTAGYVVERWVDLTLTTGADRNALDVINGNSAYVVVATPEGATSTKPPVANATPVVLTGTVVDGTLTADNLSDAAALFDIIDVNLVMNIPDAYDLSNTDAKNVYNAYIAKADERGDSFVVVDVPVNYALSGVSGATSFAADITASANAAVFFPNLVVANPVPNTSGRTIVTPPGGSVAGLFLATDASRGVFKSPAGVSAVLNNVVGTATAFTSTDLDTLNSAARPVNAIRPVPGAGVCVMGSRTVKNTRGDRYVAPRRTLLSIKKAITQRTEFAVFENNDYRLWENVRTVCSAYLNNLWQAGGLKGNTPAQAFYVKVDATNNTSSSIADGVLNIEVGVALQNPAEFVVIRIGQFDGGATVTEQNA